MAMRGLYGGSHPRGNALDTRNRNVAMWTHSTSQARRKESDKQAKAHRSATQVVTSGSRGHAMPGFVWAEILDGNCNSKNERNETSYRLAGFGTLWLKHGPKP